MTWRPPSSDSERLAAVSRTVAEAFDAAAPAVHDAFRRTADDASAGDGIIRWTASGIALAEAGAPAHGSALAYFRLPPARIAALGVPVLERWAGTATTVARVSGTLAAAFCEATAPLLGATSIETLEQFAAEGVHLRGLGGWRGDRLARAFYDAAETGVTHVPSDRLRTWTTLASAIQPIVDEGRFFSTLPTEVTGWSVDERRTWLDAALALAGRAQRPAAALYVQVPSTVDPLPSGQRAPLLACSCAAATHAAIPEVDAMLPLLAAFVTAVPPDRRDAALAIAARVADAFPVGVPGVLRNLGRVFEEATPDRVEAWAIRGLALASENPEAGHAYFALESRTSLQVLRETPTAATLDDVQGVLRKLIHMLSGEPATPRPVAAFQLRPPLEESEDGAAVALPAVVDLLPTYEENARLLQVQACMLAGRREFDTYAALAALTARKEASDRGVVLEELFRLTDGYRVARRLAATYPGIAAHLRWTGERLLAPLCRRADTFDALLGLSLASTPAARVPPWLSRTAALVLPSIEPLAAPTATARDALRVAEQLVHLFPETDENEGAGALLPELVTLMIDAAGGDEPYPGGSWDDIDGPGLAGDPVDEVPAELAQELELLLDEQLDDPGTAGRPLTPEELQQLLEAALDTPFAQTHGTDIQQMGLYVTQLLGKRLAERPPVTMTDTEAETPIPLRPRPTPPTAEVYLYDEWDHRIGDYRPAWCRLHEMEVAGDSGVFFENALARHAELVPEIRRHFLRVRPEMYRPLRGLEDGDDFDLNAVVDARVQRRAHHTPSPKLYTTRTRQERDVATLFLLDMSASTDETAPDSDERIIDIAKDALVIMAAALEEIGDAYAVYGFSGQGRENVEVYRIKEFGERLTPAVQGRLGGIEPRGSTRMGTALRHVVTKMRNVTAPARHLVLLSDGFPQDLDYGQDRQSHVYGIRDTAVALHEAEREGIRPFCITVDLAGHDYLREMCDDQQYLIIENVADLPRQLPKIYQRLVRAA